MLPPLYRLTRMKDYEILFKEGLFVASNLVNVKIWKIDPLKYPRRNYAENELRIGFIVTTKISKLAVKRNRAKRQMREVVRLLLKEGKIKSGFLVAVLAKETILQAEYLQIEEDVVKILKRAGVFIV